MSGLTKAQIRQIRGLARRHEREAAGAFVVEGDKLCREWLLSSARIQSVVCTAGWADEASILLQRHPRAEISIVPPHDLERISTLQSPPPALLVAALPEVVALPTQQWAIALDDVQDPGNVGTILRVADWFGIPHVVCSPATADAFSPKVVQAGMGAHLRVAVHRTEIQHWLRSVTVPVLAADMAGPSVHERALEKAAVLLIGNESRGLSDGLIRRADAMVSIPKLGGAESLNAAVAAGILCAVLRKS